MAGGGGPVSLFGKIFVILNFVMAILLIVIIITLYGKEVPWKDEAQFWKYYYHLAHKQNAKEEQALQDQRKNLLMLREMMAQQNNRLSQKIQDQITQISDLVRQVEERKREVQKFTDLYEGGQKRASAYEKIIFARFTLDWLTDGKDTGKTTR